MSSIVTLLQAALILISLAQGPNVPQALHDQAVLVAMQAIAEATKVLAPTASTTGDQLGVASNPSTILETPFLENSCPYVLPPECGNGTLVSNGVDVAGCFMGYRCVVSTTSSPEVCASGSCISSTSSTPLSCTLSNVTIRSGQSYTFYSTPIAADCDNASQLRFCSSGKLDGDAKYFFSSCIR